MNQNIKGDFQICISVPLSHIIDYTPCLYNVIKSFKKTLDSKKGKTKN